MRASVVSAALAALASLSAPAFAADGDAPLPAPATQTQNNVTFLSGGVSLGERDRMQGIAQGFNLKVVSAAKAGNYLADVKISVRDGQGRELVNTTTEGPVFLAQLPPGRYTVAATSGERTIERGATVSRKRQTVLDLRF